VKEEVYSGFVYDINVPNHVFMVRRNGKAVWSGNSDDDEGAAWIRSGYWPILFICGNKVDLKYDKERYPRLDWCHIGELKAKSPEQAQAALARLEKYKVVVTVPSFYFNPNEMFHALSDLIELLKLRGKSRWAVDGKRKILCLIVREAKILLASRYWAGAVQSRQDAEMDLIDLNDKAYHCYDSQTEVLTERGWRLFRERNGARVLSLNPDTFEMEYLEPVRDVAQIHKGSMVSKKGRCMNFRVTDGHNFFIRTQRKKWQFRKADALALSDVVKVNSGIWRGRREERFILPGVEADSHTALNSAKAIPMEKWLWFMGLWLADGSCDTRANEYRVSIGQSKFKEEVFKAMEEIEIGPVSRVKNIGELEEFTIHRKQLYEYLKQFGHAREKFVPQFVKELPPDQIRNFLKGYAIGDGHNHKKTRYYTTTSKRMADDLQELILKSGKAASIKRRKGVSSVKRSGEIINPKGDYFVVSTWRNPVKSIGRTKIEYAKEETVYCVELPKNHIMYVRRNGKPMWCGNTGLALAFDSLRFTSITPEVRDIADYTFIKRLGRMKIPKELNYILRYARPRYLRRMPKAEFVLYTDTDDIYSGHNAAVKWHVNRGEAPLDLMGIKPEYNVNASRPATPEGAAVQTTIEEANEVQSKKWKVAVAIHKRIVQLVIVEGLSVRKAADKLEHEEKDPIKLSISTVHAEVKSHRSGLCLCVVSSGGMVAPEGLGEPGGEEGPGGEEELDSK